MATSSDHSLITFKITEDIQVISMPDRRRYNDKKIDQPRFCAAVAAALSQQMNTAAPVAERARCFTEALCSSCETTLPRRQTGTLHTPPWWNADLSESRRILKRAHRVMLRSSHPNDRDSFKTARNRYVANIRKAKRQIWRSIVADQGSVDNRVWGSISKWIIHERQVKRLPSVLKRGDGTYTNGIADTVGYIMDVLIPHSDNDRSPAEDLDQGSPIRDTYSVSDIKDIVWRQKHKAPGKHGLSSRILRAAWPAVGAVFTKIINDCISQEIFPDCWKQAEIVVLLKGKDKDPL